VTIIQYAHIKSTCGLITKLIFYNNIKNKQLQGLSLSHSIQESLMFIRIYIKSWDLHIRSLWLCKPLASPGFLKILVAGLWVLLMDIQKSRGFSLQQLKDLPFLNQTAEWVEVLIKAQR